MGMRWGISVHCLSYRTRQVVSPLTSHLDTHTQHTHIHHTPHLIMYVYSHCYMLHSCWSGPHSTWSSCHQTGIKEVVLPNSTICPGCPPVILGRVGLGYPTASCIPLELDRLQVPITSWMIDHSVPVPIKNNPSISFKSVSSAPLRLSRIDTRPDLGARKVLPSSLFSTQSSTHATQLMWWVFGSLIPNPRIKPH